MVAQLPLTPTKEHERSARRLAAFVNDPLAPKLVKNALLSFLVEAAEVTKTPVLYTGDDELQVSSRDLAFMLCLAERLDLDFQRGGIVGADGEFIQKRK
jgi:hypothetical protein